MACVSVQYYGQCISDIYLYNLVIKNIFGHEVKLHPAFSVILYIQILYSPYKTLQSYKIIETLPYSSITYCNVTKIHQISIIVAVSFKKDRKES